VLLRAHNLLQKGSLEGASRCLFISSPTDYSRDSRCRSHDFMTQLYLYTRSLPPPNTDTMSKTKTVHFFRHAQAQHNFCYEHNPEPVDIRDTSLTHHGIEQAKEILTGLGVQNFRKPTLVISSPLRRCLQTALYAFHPSFNENLKATLEKNKKFPNSSLSKKEIQTIFKNGNIKFETDPRIMEYISSRDSMAQFPTPVMELPENIREIFTFPETLFPPEPDSEWLERTGPYKDYALRRLAYGRVNKFFDYLYSRPEDEIIVVTHGDLLKSFIFPQPWNQPIHNASGYSFIIKWDEATAVNYSKKNKNKGIQIVLKHMEEIKPGLTKLLKIPGKKDGKTDKSDLQSSIK
jgi:broad specificity phosphatase PhoE